MTSSSLFAALLRSRCASLLSPPKAPHLQRATLASPALLCALSWPLLDHRERCHAGESSSCQAECPGVEVTLDNYPVPAPPRDALKGALRSPNGVHRSGYRRRPAPAHGRGTPALPPVVPGLCSRRNKMGAAIGGGLDPGQQPEQHAHQHGGVRGVRRRRPRVLQRSRPTGCRRSTSCGRAWG